jgi:hypothetical protein
MIRELASCDVPAVNIEHVTRANRFDLDRDLLSVAAPDVEHS